MSRKNFQKSENGQLNFNLFERNELFIHNVEWRLWYTNVCTYGKYKLKFNFLREIWNFKSLRLNRGNLRFVTAIKGNIKKTLPRDKFGGPKLVRKISQLRFFISTPNKPKSPWLLRWAWVSLVALSLLELIATKKHSKC